MSTGPPDNLMKDQQAPRNVSHGHAVSDQAAEILRLYQDEKLKMVAVAARLGLTEWRVWTTLHSMGVPLRPKGRPKGSWNARPLVWLDEARRLYQSGKSLDDVADAKGGAEERCGEQERQAEGQAEVRRLSSEAPLQTSLLANGHQWASHWRDVFYFRAGWGSSAPARAVMPGHTL